MDRLWTIREAAAIADLPAKTLRSLMEREGLKPEPARELKPGSARLLSMRDLVYLKLMAEFPFALGKADKAALEGLVRRRKVSAFSWRSEGHDVVLRTGKLTVRVDCSRLRESLVRNAAVFDWGQRRIVSDRAVLNGEPVFRDTSVALAEVTRLIRAGAPDAKLSAEFPELSCSDLDFARIHARMGKRPGRPRKPLEVRRRAKAA
jgi:uncharacterized protein (DUF433 family)